MRINEHYTEQRPSQRAIYYHDPLYDWMQVTEDVEQFSSTAVPRWFPEHLQTLARKRS